MKILFLILFFSQFAFAEDTRITNPNAFSLEMFGRGLLFSVDYDRVVTPDLVVGIGIGDTPVSISGVSGTQSASLIPVYVNYYFTRDQGSIFLTGGLTYVANASAVAGENSNLSSLTFNSNSVLPTFGLGYENRGDSGFLFRLAGYAMYGANWAPWVGVSGGYSF